MRLRIELTEKDLRRLVQRYIEEKMNHSVDPNMVQIQVKSTQNYKSEWEIAAFKAVYTEII